MATPSDWVFVWTWLPDAVDPVPAGAVRWNGDLAEFAYSDQYLARSDRRPLAPELPIAEGWIEPHEGLTLAGCLRDALPDQWGQGVLRTERPDEYADANEDRTDMLLSGSDRFGAIDFQASDQVYAPRLGSATLDELHQAAELLEAGEQLSPVLGAALLHGTSIGGARPKALLHDGSGRSLIAKFSSTSDRGLPVVNAEAACLDLARRAGITAPASEVTKSLGKDVLLVERFDRDRHGHRFHTVSALTLLGLDPIAGRWATYPDLYDRLVDAGASPETGAELFDRIVFNVAISNSDDHARNHAAFWDGRTLGLTPAYDLAPGHRSGDTAKQALAIGREGQRDSNFVTCMDAASVYGLSRREASDSIDRITTVIRECWDEAADRARLTRAQRDRLLGRQILNPAASYGYEPRVIPAPSTGWAWRAL
ncbi:MAG: type II toxin-antitoxin system HipA family toxin [Nocardioidaceae bacterium]